MIVEVFRDIVSVACFSLASASQHSLKLINGAGRGIRTLGTLTGHKLAGLTNSRLAPYRARRPRQHTAFVNRSVFILLDCHHGRPVFELMANAQ
jgi:hypothetical protein